MIYKRCEECNGELQFSGCSSAGGEMMDCPLCKARAEIKRLREERLMAVKMARMICRDNDWVDDWPDSLHLADVIEKRIYNLTLDWRNAAEVMEKEKR